MRRFFLQQLITGAALYTAGWLTAAMWASGEVRWRLNSVLVLAAAAVLLIANCVYLRGLKIRLIERERAGKKYNGS